MRGRSLMIKVWVMVHIVMIMIVQLFFSAVPDVYAGAESQYEFIEGQQKITEYNQHVVILIADSNKIYQAGKVYTSPQPITVKQGVSYIALRSLIDRFGFKLDYDHKTKETMIKRGAKQLCYKQNSINYRINNVATKMKGASYIEKNIFMVPVTSAMDALSLPYKWEQVTKRIIIQLSSNPVAKFAINENDIIAGETHVTVNNQSFHPQGLQIVNEEWSGLQDVYDEPGTYTITLRVQDEYGKWSDLYTQMISVQKPHVPPKASFCTDKKTYKMGEQIRYENLSTDEEDTNLKQEWNNNKRAFFTPGQHTITLKVTNKYGLTAETSQVITVTNETLYSFDDFNKLFTPMGEIYPVNGSSMLTLQEVKPLLSEEKRTLYRSNSPEVVKMDGILYQDRVAGGVRVFAHHINRTPYNMKFYLVVKNVSDDPATVTVQRQGMAGPDKSPEGTGSKGTMRYFESFAVEYDIGNDMFLKPNETKIIVPELSDKTCKPDQVFTLYADLYSDQTIEYTVVAVNEKGEVLQQLPSFNYLTKDQHIRGTFHHADRILTVNEQVGQTTMRMVIGDGKNDKDIVGMDTITEESQLNRGNYGVLYRIILQKVAPHTLISFNPRGGVYAGALSVQGQMVGAPNNGALKTSNEASVVYRTGDREEKVEILFSAAAGGNLPVNFLFIPLPPKKG